MLKWLNYTIIGLLAIALVLLLSSFVFQMFVIDRVDPELDRDIPSQTVERVIQVNIMNACGVNGLAAKTKNFMRSRGFDVVEIGNFRKKTEHSFVIDRLGDTLSSQKVAYVMGLSEDMVETDIDSMLFLRATIVIGSDYKELSPFKE